MARLVGSAVAVIALGTILLAMAACERQPGSNAYGRYQGASSSSSNSSNSSNAVYDRLKSTDKDDWFKDRPM